MRIDPWCGRLFVAVVLASSSAEGQWTTRISKTTGGVEANVGAAVPAISADGRFVAFSSYSTNLVAGDTNGSSDGFLRDRVAGTTEMVTLTSTGSQGDSHSFPFAVTPDGRYVVFISFASNMIPGDSNPAGDLLVRDRNLGTTEVVSVDSAGNQGDGDGFDWASISDDARFVAFASVATNLVAGDTNAAYDVFVHDRQTGMTERVSVDSTGAQGDGGSFGTFMSSNGRFVVFRSTATNLVAGDTNAEADIFLHDRQTGLTERVSVDSAGVQGDGNCNPRPSVSSDGRYVEFGSVSTNLVAGDTNGGYDIFVHDRQTGVTERVSVTTGGAETTGGGNFYGMISADGRFVAINCHAPDLVAGDTNGLPDVFVRDRLAGTTERVSLDSSGVEANFGSDAASISANGRCVAFMSQATNLDPPDTNGSDDIFLRDRILSGEMTTFCYPDQGGIRSCPCGNPSGSGTVGCNNFGPSPSGGTGGAQLAATGTASIAGDTIQFQVTSEQTLASNISILFQGTTTLGAGAQSGAGVRCIGGTLKRLYKGNASGGAINFPTGAQPAVHTASASLGFPIVPPVTLYYYAAYRNSAAGAPCGSPTLGFNTTNAGALHWIP